MERVGKSLVKLKLSGKAGDEDLALAAWPEGVGKRIARHAAAVALVRDKLVVEVEDAIWQQQLWQLREHILKRLRSMLGDELVRDLEFRIAAKRRPPETAVSVRNDTDQGDDADRIEDNVLRFVYKQSRKKASA